MEQDNLYEVIFKRKSVRKYDLTPLDGNILAEIMAFLSTVKPLDGRIQTDMKLISQKDIQSMLPKAPHYIAVFSEPKDGYLTNLGFMLQQVDLFLAANGIGTCWQGMSKPSPEILNSSKLKFVIVLAAGKPLEPLYRQNISEFKRKPLEQITNISGMEELLEPVRLAPSGINSQPWFFTGSHDLIHAYCSKANFMKAFIYEKMNRIDMGIALCHLWMAARHLGKTVEFIYDETARNSLPAKHYYIITLKIK